MFKFKKGMICLLETNILGEDEDTGETAILVASGTPVKIVEIVEPACAAMVSGECQAPCKGYHYARTIVVETFSGLRWIVDYDVEDADYPLVAINGGDCERLLQRQGWKQFKMADWTDHGIRSKYAGPFNFAVGVGMITVSKNLPGIWSLIGTIVGCLIGLYGSTMFIVGNKYLKNPISYGEFYFYRNYVVNRIALETLIQKGD